MGKGGCSKSCNKYLLFFFNGLFCICGLAILAVGLWVRFDKNLSDHVGVEGADTLYAGAYVIIAFGAFMVVVTFLGCCGAIRDSQCMLVTFFIILFVIFIGLLGGAIYIIVQQDEIKEVLTKYYDTTLNDAVKLTRESLKCCSGKPVCNPTVYLNHRCEDAVWEEVRTHALILAGIALGVAAILILGMIMSMCLCCSIRKENYTI